MNLLLLSLACCKVAQLTEVVMIVVVKEKNEFVGVISCAFIFSTLLYHIFSLFSVFVFKTHSSFPFFDDDELSTSFLFYFPFLLYDISVKVDG